MHAELTAWREAGRTPELWWRDDDASVLTPALKRLLALSQSSAVPLAVAAIPLLTEEQALADARFVLMHGCDHRNRAAPGEKKTEFSAAEPDDAALERLAGARERLAGAAGERFIPVLVPPWNRLKASLVPRLPAVGIDGLSCYGAHRVPVRGVHQVNTHVDIVDWRGSRGFIGEEAALSVLVAHLAARRRNERDADEPTGLLTHHAVHEAQAWRFIARLFDETRQHGARWLEPRTIFRQAR